MSLNKIGPRADRSSWLDFAYVTHNHSRVYLHLADSFMLAELDYSLPAFNPPAAVASSPPSAHNLIS